MIKYLRKRRELATAEATRARAETGISITRTQSRAASIHDRVVVLEPDVVHSPCCSQGWLWPEGARKAGEIDGFSSIQAYHTGQTLARHPSRTGA